MDTGIIQSFKDLFENSKSSRGLVGMEVGPGGVAFAYCTVTAGATPVLNLCDYVEDPEPLKQKVHILDWVAKNKCKGLRCNVSLHPKYYHLLLVEVPNVPKEEMNKALKWRIKDLIPYSVDEIYLDHFLLPDDAFRGEMRMAYVAVVHNDIIKKTISMTEKCGLVLDSIDIRELAIRNLLFKQFDPSENMAFIALRRANSLILLVSNNQIYLCRRVDLKLDKLKAGPDETQSFLDELMVEVHRSIDYFENQLGKGSIHRLVLSPSVYDMGQTLNYLKEQISNRVSYLEFDKFMNLSTTYEEKVLAQSMGAVGAALRVLT